MYITEINSWIHIGLQYYFSERYSLFTKICIICNSYETSNYRLNMNFSIRMGYALFTLCFFAYYVVFLFCLSSTCVTLAVSPDYQYLIGPSVLTNVYYLLHINLVIIHIPPYPPGYHPYTPISTRGEDAGRDGLRYEKCYVLIYLLYILTINWSAHMDQADISVCPGWKNNVISAWVSRYG